ncbi:RHS repeat-associated core domain-containing protein [Paenibacillus radicis (ex Gao et al. 2016)]|uniref:Teneurin-like YD-shell domain-containing protein n=1 Tax=Paenibacillus radicis (ex Gao et al. 2016) TaxID=1737354 RepID=A0A917HPM6_9BACL|nr:RHS repeat-associated core domain-containing protein [Paenibacillus radicis (ex Gao et al. 2016)]GGG85239.1 hypothetical protein GCM10010918_48960 [Paenibacillus radicis (ex Gao et al. 2016)]
MRKFTNKFKWMAVIIVISLFLSSFKDLAYANNNNNSAIDVFDTQLPVISTNSSVFDGYNSVLRFEDQERKWINDEIHQRLGELNTLRAQLSAKLEESTDINLELGTETETDISINEETDTESNAETVANEEIGTINEEIQTINEEIDTIGEDRELSERVIRLLEREQLKALDERNEQMVGLSIESVAEAWNVDEQYIQDQLDLGQTLEQVEKNLYYASSLTVETELQDQLNLQTVTHSTYQNQSSENEGIVSEVANKDYAIANLFRAAGLPPAPEEPKLDMLKIKLDEAPYQINLETENVSTISGGLSLSEQDLSLPGRNGNGFTLTRTYDSGSSQLYDADIQEINSSYYEHYAQIDYNVQIEKRKYYYNYQYHVFKEKYQCSNNRFIQTEGERWTDAVQSSYYDTAVERDAAALNIGTPGPTTIRDVCKTEDRKYVEKYYLKLITSSEMKYSHSEYDSDFEGPFGSVAEATSVVNSYNNRVGQLDGSDTSGNTVRKYYIKGASVYTDSTDSRSYINKLSNSKDQARFPLGVGWTWDIPYLTFDNGTYVHLSGGGSYKVENNYLKGYPWKDLTLVPDTTVNVNGLQSAMVLKSITGNNQYFDNTGKLIQISDAYNNNIQFKYGSVAPYGTLLTEIVDAIGNKITISYSSSEVTLTMGDRVVTYKKTLQNGKEILTQVVDAMNRTTSYNYTIKQAKFDLLSTTPTTENPYALITSVTFPTGAQTVYEYESTPTVRYTSTNSVNEVYRLAVRKDVVKNADSSTTDVNRTVFLYQTDMGSSYNQDMNFTTRMIKGQLETVYSYKKDFIDEQNPPMIYKIAEEQSDLITKRVTTNSYDEVRRIPNPISTTNYFVSNSIQSSPVTNSWTYDDYGNLLSSSDTYGFVVNYTYDPVTHLRLTERWPIFNQQDALYITMSRNAEGDVLDYQLKSNNLSAEFLKRTIYAYDSFGNVISTRDFDTVREAITNYEYDPSYGSAYLTKQTELYKDADNISRSRSAVSTYDKLTGNMLTYTDGRGSATSYLHDKLDRITQITNPDLSTFKVSYDDLNNAIITTNETNIRTKSTWDTIGRLVETGLYENGIYKVKTKTGYDALSRKLWEEDPSGNRIAYTYDHWDRLIKTSNADLSFSTVTYDDIANTVTDTDEENNKIIKYADKLDRTVQEKELENGVWITKSTTLYNPAGHISQTKDALNNVTQYSYDLLGQLIGVRTPKDEVFSYSYDKLGNMSGITYPGNNRIIKKYDEVGQLIQYTDESGANKKMYYDLSGNLSKLIDRKNQTFTYQYDSKNRLLERKGPSETITYTYEADGKRSTMNDKTGVTKYAYDSNTGLLAKKTYPDNKTIQYKYDLRGNKTQITDPFGIVTDYQYDTVNRLSTVRTNNATTERFQYYKNDQLKSVMHGNDMSSEYGYKGFDLSSLKHIATNRSTINSFEYTNDANGNVTSRTENGVNYSYTYDSLGRIQSNSQFNEQYEYDPRGNRISLISEDSSFSLNDYAYTHDEWNRLTSVKENNQLSAEYTYNGDDKLYERKENGITTRYYWDDEHIVGEATVSATQITPVASYIYGNNSLLERIDAATHSRAYYILNGHQDVIEIRDQSGNLLNKYSYDIWGKPLAANTTETIANPFRYSSEYWDSKSNLLYLSTRWYDPSTARFLEQDTFEGELKNPLSLNQYTYAHNDPISYSDPTGNFAFLIPLAIYVGKVAIKTAVDVSIDYASAKASGTKFNAGKSILSNSISNAVPGLGEAKTISKIAKAGKVIQAAKASKNAGKVVEKNTGKAKNFMKSDKEATGDHTVLKRDPKTKEVTNYETYKSNPRNPNGFDKVQRYDGIGKGHHNKLTGKEIPTPHVNGKSIPGGVRPAYPNEIPKKRR